MCTVDIHIAEATDIELCNLSAHACISRHSCFKSLLLAVTFFLEQTYHGVIRHSVACAHSPVLFATICQ
jgi:hypothetical protein